MRNKLQAAVRYFEMRCEGKTDFEALAMCDRREMERTALSALRDALQRQPDPITGYLVGTVDRWNDAKQHELKDRVKHEGT